MTKEPQAMNKLAPQTLTLKNLVLTRHIDFRKETPIRTGSTNPYEKPRLMSDPRYEGDYGYVWDHPLIGEKDPWPAKANFNAVSSMYGSLDISPNRDLLEILPETQRSIRRSAQGLEFKPIRMPQDLKAQLRPNWPWEQNAEYLSGAYNTFPYSSQYGVIMAQIQTPKAKGLWPAFWGMPANQAHPPELDIMEQWTAKAEWAFQTLHQAKGPRIGNKIAGDFSGWHHWALWWTEHTMAFYIDWNKRWELPTPTEFHQPFYWIIDLALGGIAGKPGQMDYLQSMTTQTFTTMQFPEYIKGGL